MVRYESFCCSCPPELGCKAPNCPNLNVPIWSCDECEEDNVDLYEVDGYEVCEKCALKMLPMVHKE